MNLFDFHTNPGSLLWGVKRDLLPWDAYNRLLKGPDRPTRRVIRGGESVWVNKEGERPQRHPELEPFIMRTPETAVKYATYFICGPWEEAEPYILQSPRWTMDYITGPLNGEEWEEAEDTLIRTASTAVTYAMDVMNRRWYDAEPIIRNSEWWEDYAAHFRLGDWYDNEDMDD